MSTRGLLAPVRSTIVGWVALLAVIFLIERPLLRWTAPILGASWLPTVQLILECLGLTAVGWLIGRWGKPGVLIFAATVALLDFTHILAIDVPWLFHLLVDCFQNSRYLESFFTSLATHVFLFGSLFVGARLSRVHERALLRIQ